MTPELEQIKTLIDRSRSILITTRQQASFDEVASCLAWHWWLTRLGKTAEILIEHHLLSQFQWLPGSEFLKSLESEGQSGHNYILRIKTDKVKLSELKYQIKDSYLEICLATKEGVLNPTDVEPLKADFAHDLIIVIGAMDLASIGQPFELYREQWQNIPIINIDRRLDNKSYGQVNWIKVTAASLTEMAHELMNEHLDADRAHLLLTGLISATQSFQSQRVSPETLLLASRLIVAGAKREEIVMKLYRTKDIATLKLWGKLLTRLKKQGDLVYSSIARDELGEQKVNWWQLCEELILTSPEAKIAVLFYQQEFDEIIVRVVSREPIDLANLMSRYESQGNKRQREFTLKKSLAEAQQEVTDLLGEQLKTIKSA